MKKVYIVAEISQNHNGDIGIAKDLIDEARLAGCDAVKLNKRDLSHELTDEAYDRIYDSINSFGKTYGEHRKFLEFTHTQHHQLRKYTENRGMDYLLSVCDSPSLAFAKNLKPRLIKIPSKEITNLTLLKRAALTKIPVAFSIGLATEHDILKAISLFDTRTTIVVVCTSQYPTELDNVNLNRIKSLSEDYGCRVGFSSHIPDPALGIAAVAMGAEYIEYHVTLSRKMKGSDHAVALEFEELEYMVSVIRDLQIALGSSDVWDELPVYLYTTKKKLMKKECEDGIWRIP